MCVEITEGIRRGRRGTISLAVGVVHDSVVEAFPIGNLVLCLFLVIQWSHPNRNKNLLFIRMLLSVLPEQTVGDHLCDVENRQGEEIAHAANHQTGSGDEAGHDAQAQERPEVVCSLVPRSTQCFADAGFGMIDQIDRGEYPN